LLTNFSEIIWHVAAAVNAEECMLKLSTSPDMCTHATLQCKEKQNCDKIV